MARLKKLDTEIKQANKEAEIVVISLDPARDTSEKLIEFKKKHGLDLAHCHMLGGSEDQIRELSLLLGINYQRDQKTGDINHSNKIVLLDREGTLVREVEGLNGELQPIIDAIPHPEPSATK